MDDNDPLIMKLLTPMGDVEQITFTIPHHLVARAFGKTPEAEFSTNTVIDAMAGMTGKDSAFIAALDPRDFAVALLLATRLCEIAELRDHVATLKKAAAQ